MIFISYARQDQEFVRRLAGDLEVTGVDVWVDWKDIPAGMNWEGAIDQALQKSAVMILAISPASMNARHVEAEASHFRDHNKPIIPILLEPASLPFWLRHTQYVNFHSQDYDTALAQLLRVLEARDFRLSPEEARAQQQRLDDALQVAEDEAAAPSAKPATSGPSAVEMLAEARRHHRNGVLKKAIELYARILLDRADPEPRVQAAVALGDLRAASPDLLQSLQDDPAPAVRRAVVRALAGMQSPRIDEALQIAAVVDPDLEVRLYAALVTVYFKLPNRVASWLDALAGSRNPALRSVIGEAQLFANDLVKLTGHVFISYSRQDAERFTLELVDTLRAQHRFRVWVDTNLTPGTESWKKAIAKALEQCSLLVLILSPSVHGSKWIGEEVSYAEQLGKERLYVKYQETHLPFGMAEMQGLRADLTFEDYPDEMLAALVAELGRRNIPRLPDD